MGDETFSWFFLHFSPWNVFEFSPLDCFFPIFPLASSTSARKKTIQRTNMGASLVRHHTSPCISICIHIRASSFVSLARSFNSSWWWQTSKQIEQNLRFPLDRRTFARCSRVAKVVCHELCLAPTLPPVVQINYCPLQVGSNVVLLHHQASQSACRQLTLMDTSAQLHLLS